MHPILGQPRRLPLYLLAWIPLGAILLYLLMSLGGLSLIEGLALAVQPCLIYAFVCLSAWYSCRATPLETSSFWRLALTHVTAAILVSSVWVLIARGLAIAISNLERFRGLDQRFARVHPLLLG